MGEGPCEMGQGALILPCDLWCWSSLVVTWRDATVGLEGQKQSIYFCSQFSKVGVCFHGSHNSVQHVFLIFLDVSEAVHVVRQRDTSYYCFGLQECR